MSRILMSRSYVTRIVTVVCVLMVASVVLAGPIIDFGDDGGYLKIDLKGQVYVESTDFGTGLDLQNRRTDVHFQRLRLTATGMLNETWGYKFQTCGHIGSTKMPIGYSGTLQDVNDNDRDIRIIDTYAIAHFSDALNFKVGLTKIPVSRANLDDCFAPLTYDRSHFVYNAYGTSAAKFSRDIGLVAHGNFADDHFKYFLGAFQGREGQSAAVNPFNLNTYKTTIEPTSNFLYSARVHYSFLDPELGGGYVGTHFGDMKILTIGLGMAHESAAVYRNVNFNPSTGFDVIDDETADLNEYAADLLFEYPTSAGTITANLQYLKVDFDDAYKTNHNPGDDIVVVGGGNGQKEGGYAKLAWLMPVNLGENGRLQPYVISENWDYALISGVKDQHISQYGGGINYYIDRQNVRITAEYLQTNFEKEGPVAVGIGNVIPKMQDFGTFRTMLQLVF